MNLIPFAEARVCPTAEQILRANQHSPQSRATRFLATLLVGFTCLGATPAFAMDPCKTVLCMYGRFTGNSGGGVCSPAEQDYFDIIAKKHGKINWGKTSTLRGEFLNSCQGADSGINKKINDKFGKSMG